jgi:hypothetical protein
MKASVDDPQDVLHAERGLAKCLKRLLVPALFIVFPTSLSLGWPRIFLHQWSSTPRLRLLLRLHRQPREYKDGFHACFLKGPHLFGDVLFKC